MPRTIKRYSEELKQRIVQDISSGKYDSIAGAARAYGIYKYETVTRWLRQGGREDLCPRVVVVGIKDQ
jgi:transposase-like protein